MPKRTRFTALLLSLLFSAAPAAAAEELSKTELVEVIREIDRRQSSIEDFKWIGFVEQTEKGKPKKSYELMIYRRDDTNKLAILITRPKSEAGKGYLRVGKNLLLYDPHTGRWERRTERERIAGTESRRIDFDESRLADEFEPALIGSEALGKFKTWHMKLTAKPGAEVAFPILEIWIDKDSRNVMKVQSFSESGKLVRTNYFPKWTRQKNDATGAEVYVPGEFRVYDEVEKGKSTVVITKSVELKALPDSQFSKAWLEGKSR